MDLTLGWGAVFGIPWIRYVTVGLALIIGYKVWYFTQFIRSGIPGPLPLPLYANILRSREAYYLLEDRWVKIYGKVVGFFSVAGPTLLISDVKILKQIFVKDFKSFRNRAMVKFTQSTRLHNMLISLEDEHWKNMRNVISPAFTSAKIKQMAGMINECADELLLQKMQQSIKDNTPLDITKLYGKFSIGCIATAGFGVKLQAQSEDEVTLVDFQKNATEFFSRLKSSKWLLMGVLHNFIPTFIIKYFDIDLVSQESEQFIFDMSEAILKKRNEGTMQGHIMDFMQLLINAHELEDEDVSSGQRSTSPGTTPKKTKLSTDDVVSQCVMFLLAGYETTSACLTFTSYLLATHPDIQDKVTAEIQEVMLTMATTSVTLDLLTKMPYLEMVVNESLRMYPPISRLTRDCCKDTEILGLHIKQGTRILAPVWNIQQNPDHWPNPMTFDPDRFSPQYKGSVNMDAFLPFGAGPRSCLGTRFAFMEIKIALARTLVEFKIEMTDETPKSLELSKGVFLAPGHPVPLKFIQRT